MLAVESQETIKPIRAWGGLCSARPVSITNRMILGMFLDRLGSQLEHEERRQSVSDSHRDGGKSNPTIHKYI